MASTKAGDSEQSALAVSPATLLKVDTQGRIWTSKARRREILDEFEKGGISAAQFARITGLKYSTLAGWLQRARRTRSESRKRARSGLQLVEAVVDQAQRPGEGAVVVYLPGQVRLELSSLPQVPVVAALAKALLQPAPRC
jgi:lambda repressor-like predicted transcriptional regulator